MVVIWVHREHELWQTRFRLVKLAKSGLPERRLPYVHQAGELIDENSILHYVTNMKHRAL